MEIKIITIHAMHNPGSVLQAYALQKYLDNNHRVEIIDYRPDYFYNEGSKLKLLLKKILYRKAYYSRHKKFTEFINNQMKLTSKYCSFEELKNAHLSADVFIAGSDQLWNTDFACGNDLAFYLKFVDSGKKISYSTSVGKKIIDENNMQVLKENLSDFDKLAVREKSTSIKLSKVLNMKVEWVCDPVFLLTEKSYLNIMDTSPLVNEKYVMVYLAPESKLLDSIVSYYREKGLKIVLAGGVTKRCECDQHIVDVGPIDFLNLIYYADVVVSTSFHATAFCHIFHKEFIAITPKRNGERIMSLLEQTGLTNRAVSEEQIFKGTNKRIEWEKVDMLLEKYVDSSRKYLKDALKK